jgi:ligand-binding SRPBCC domain-containing protein
MIEVERTTRLAAPAATVWDRAVTPEGINDELRPWMRMTMPRSLRGKTVADVRPGDRPGRSWLLLFGVLPVDYDDLGIAELEPGRRFLEQSTMLSMSTWQHERVIDPAGERGCRVTDRLTFELRGPLARVPGAERLARATIEFLFRNRHARLARRFGAAA